MKDKVDLSIVILNYNTKDLTIKCIKSVFARTRGLGYELIVVDNASTDGSVDTLRNFRFQISDFKLIENRKNLGFTGGNNLGVRQADGRYILLLNSDTYLSGNSLRKMVDFMDQNLRVGVATCQLKNVDGTLQPSGGFSPTLPRVFAWMFFIDDIPFLSDLLKPFHPHVDSGIFDRDHEQDWITGAFFMLRKEVVKEVGLLDDDYFMYMEDVDYCWRAKREGWKIFYTTTTSITHIGGASGGSENTIISELKNLRLFYQKHQPVWQQLLLSLIIKCGVLLRLLLFGVAMGQREKLRIYGKAFATI